DTRPHQGFSDTLALPFSGYADVNGSNVPPPRLVGKRVHSEHSHHPVVRSSDEVKCSFGRFRKSSPPLFTRWVWQLERALKYIGRNEHFVDRRRILRFGSTYDETFDFQFFTLNVVNNSVDLHF